MLPTIKGSSPNVSPTLPQRGSLNISIFGVKVQWLPVALISFAVCLPIEYKKSSFQVDANPIGDGYTVVPGTKAFPCIASIPINTGIFNGDFKANSCK